MDSLIALYAILVLLVTGLAWLAVRATARQAWRMVAMCLASALLVTGYAGLLELLGRPKPIELAWSPALGEDAEVVASAMQEGEAIYLWLRRDQAPEPRSYRLPWSLDQAKRLQQAQQQAEASGTGVRMRRPNDNLAEEDEPLFYAAPQEALRPKQ